MSGCIGQNSSVVRPSLLSRSRSVSAYAYALIHIPHRVSFDGPTEPNNVRSACMIGRQRDEPRATAELDDGAAAHSRNRVACAKEMAGESAASLPHHPPSCIEADGWCCLLEPPWSETHTQARTERRTQNHWSKHAVPFDQDNLSKHAERLTCANVSQKGSVSVAGASL